MPTWVNSRNFTHDGTMYRRGEIHPNPRPALVRIGLVREAKIARPVEYKEALIRNGQRQSNRTSKSDRQLDD